MPLETEDTLAAQDFAALLLMIEAVHLRPEQPFILTSGLASPIYVDCRKIISFPEVRQTLMRHAVHTLINRVGENAFDSVAGGETAGIPFAAWVADLMNLPMQYVRKKPKGFGRDAQIEGAIYPKQRVLLVEDMTTDGGSKLNFAAAIRQAEAVVKEVLVIYYYNIFGDSANTLAQAGLRLHYLFNAWDLLAAIRNKNYSASDNITALEAFLADPRAWSAAHHPEKGQ